MSEEDSPSYKDGDIVWVKLGTSWWPGEVTETGPEDLNVKKVPLVIVQFFNEGTYQFVYNYNQIYPFNCERKDEFIKKGMDSFRANNAHMEKFPIDVSYAESKIPGGNPNILSDPKYAPQKRTSIVAEVFGDPTPKKTPKDGKGRGRASAKSSTKKPKVNITHRRFLGFDDYEARIRLQYPGKDTEHFSDEESERVVPEPPPQNFLCSLCSFETSRLEVMVYHTQWHNDNVSGSGTTKKKGSPKKRSPKKSRAQPKHITSEDDRANSSTGYMDTDTDEDVKPKPKRKRKTGTARSSKQRRSDNGNNSFTDIRTNLLAEWSDSDDMINDSKKDETIDKKNSENDNEERNTEDESSQKDNSKSCFDFDDDEEDNNIVHTAVGRKIPRVIPQNDKKKSGDPDNEDASLPVAEDDENRMEIIKETEKVNDNNGGNNGQAAEADNKNEDAEFKKLLESAVVPELPELPGSVKSPENFPNSKNLKIPDKKSENSTEVATKLTNPKKRFVKSFEDFELLQNEQRKAQEEKEKIEEEKAKLESVEINKTATENEKVKDDKTSQEKSDNVKPIDEEAAASLKEVDKKEDNEKVEEEDESKQTDEGGLKIAKLKCQLMSKMADDEEQNILKSPIRTSTRSHRTPRSKYLENLRNNKTTSEKKPLKRDDESPSTSKGGVKPATRKSKYLQYHDTDEEEEDKIEEEISMPKEITKSPAKTTTTKVTADKVKKDGHGIIEDIMNDFLMDLDQKVDEEDKIQKENKLQKTMEKTKDEIVQETNKPDANEVSTTAENDVEKLEMANLSKLNKTDDELSALTTLAMVSEMEKINDKTRNVEVEHISLMEEAQKTAIEEHFASKLDTELVPIDGNLTVVSEKELADAQVEITADISPNSKKPVTLTTFSMDFSDSNSSNKNENEIADDNNKQEEKKVAAASIEIATTSVQKPIEVVVGKKVDKVEEPTITIASIVEKPVQKALPSKLLERLTTTAATPQEIKQKETVQIKTVKVPVTSSLSKDNSSKAPLGKTKFVIKSTTPKLVKGTSSGKPVILSEKIIKPEKSLEDSTGVSVQKITSKRLMQDADEIDTFIIQKGNNKKTQEDTDDDAIEGIPSWKKYKKTIEPKKSIQQQIISPAATMSPLIKKKGKAKILQQTIITPSGEIIQPGVSQNISTVVDDFDINSMPIVLSDEILTPESIENMPIFITDSEKITSTPKVQHTIVKKMPQQQQQMRILNKSVGSSNLITTPVEKSKLIKSPKIVNPTVGQKIIKQNSFTAGKHGKFVIVSQPSSSASGSKYTVGKKQTIIKRSVPNESTPTGTLTKLQQVTPEPSGNKIMILTNQQGQQQRVLLTPAQQKMMGYQNQGPKVTKTVIKGNIVQKKEGVASQSGLIGKSTASPRLQTNQQLITSTGQILTPLHQSKQVRIEKTLPVTRKLQVQSQKVNIGHKPQKTILIKNQLGQTVRKIQGTDDELLDKQVAEQIQAIKASGALQQKQDVLNYRTTTTATTPKTAIRRSYAKKIVESPKPGVKSHTISNSSLIKSDSNVPPLAPISPKKTIEQPLATSASSSAQDQQQNETKSDRPLNQLVIQDALGNQTTITEGQILALPSETIDGQPQGYMLVTLDESGNLTPLNNEALMSLDPNLGLGGDLGNTVLQIDQSALKDEAINQAETEAIASTSAGSTNQSLAVTTAQQDVIESTIATTTPSVTQAAINNQKEQQQQDELIAASNKTDELDLEQQGANLQSVNCNVSSGDTGQQLIVTGDPIAAQKFLESLTEGNSDLANILANAEGSILIHADGQQILINTDSDNQMLLSVNNDNLNMTESTEGDGNPIFANQPSKNQDILAAALADTDVFQQDQNGSQNKVAQLSPNSSLYPMNVTSLTLNSPIMTPLEVPSTNNKKISDESDILNQVPKNVDLPITITDPNISQTVSQQQVATMIANELHSNLELAISDSSIPATSEMNSPSFAYSLPNLDGAVDINQKPFNSSMPLLTEDTDDVTQGANDVDKKAETAATLLKTSDIKDDEMTSKDDNKIGFMRATQGLRTLGTNLCGSLSEPPPDMFDLAAVLSTAGEKNDEDGSKDGTTIEKGGDESASSESVNPETTSVTETSSPNTVNEDSCEIPVQPEIVTTLEGDNFGTVSSNSGTNKRQSSDKDDIESKKCKFD